MSDKDNNMGAMLSLTFEIEGLLLLLQRRGDLAHPEVVSLLNEKTAELAQLAGKIKINAQTVTEIKASASQEIVTPEPRPNVKAPEIVSESAELQESISDVEPAVEDAVLSEATVVSAVQSQPGRTPVHHEEPVKSETDTALKFTINDRFRFRKELFDGDGDSFDEALATIGSMNSVKEIEEYLSDDLCLDLENKDVADFFAIVTARFA